jgi:hypothetical protein
MRKHLFAGRVWVSFGHFGKQGFQRAAESLHDIGVGVAEFAYLSLLGRSGPLLAHHGKHVLPCGSLPLNYIFVHGNKAVSITDARVRCFYRVGFFLEQPELFVANCLLNRWVAGNA